MIRITRRLIICSLISIALATGAGLSVCAEDAAGAEPEAASESNAEPPLAPQSVAAAASIAPPTTAGSPSPAEFQQNIFEIAEREPWDYSPYRVLIWLVCDDPSVTAASIESQLRPFLDRDFFSLWRFNVADAPAAIRSGAQRNIDALSFESITASDPVLAIKRDHSEAVRIRIAKNVGQFVTKVYGTRGRIEEVRQRASQLGDPTIDGVADRLQAISGDADDIAAMWAQDDVEGVLVSRGMAMTLTDPEAKLITPRISGLVGDAVDHYDKIFVVRIRRDVIPHQVEAVEFDTLMRHFGPVARVRAFGRKELPQAVGRAVTQAFAPIVRIDNAGQRSATGLLRAGGLITDEDSPANIRVDDVLEPMTRKNDRNGNPILIGAIDWAYLLVEEPEIAVLQAARGAKIRIGDQVASVAGKSIETPQQIERSIRQAAGNSLTIEFERDGNSQPRTFDLGSSAAPLRLRYLGFTAGERRGQAIVTGTIQGAPAEGKLRSGDLILSAGGVEITGLDSLTKSIIAIEPQPTADDADEPAEPEAIKLSVQRGEETLDVQLVPTDQSAWKRGQVRTIAMEFFAGRAGGLQGRKNKRTFRTALKVRPFLDSTMLRLHLRRYPDFPLIGYELYEKELRSADMTFIGRTDWNGRLLVEPTDNPFRLLYVKNGGAVLARLPIVPGLYPRAAADLSGDDMRLQAEAYIRGVQNSIIDLVAIRKLFEARIRMRLEKGEMEKAQTLMNALREQPSNEQLATDMGKQQTMYIQALGTQNPNQRRKVDEMFTTTRELLSAQINPRLIRQLEDEVIAAVNNGGELPEQPREGEEAGAAE